MVFKRRSVTLLLENKLFIYITHWDFSILLKIQWKGSFHQFCNEFFFDHFSYIFPHCMNALFFKNFNNYRNVTVHKSIYVIDINAFIQVNILIFTIVVFLACMKGLRLLLFRKKLILKYFWIKMNMIIL